jgi:lysophospholipase L1-like esterase
MWTTLLGMYPLFFGLIFLPSLAAVGQSTGEKPTTNKWEKDIAAFEAQDAISRPPRRAVLFVGSSSIRLWNLKESFPDLETINRGFGGSELADSVRYADRIVIKHRPRIVVLYAGDNDIAAGKSPKRVLSDFQQFVRVVQSRLPNTNIIYIAVKPSIKRWSLIDKIRETNRLIRDEIAAQKTDRLAFLDTEKPMLGDDGRPRADLLQDDGLHLNREGYKLWTSLLRPLLGTESAQVQADGRR